MAYIGQLVYSALPAIFLFIFACQNWKKKIIRVFFLCMATFGLVWVLVSIFSPAALVFWGTQQFLLLTIVVLLFVYWIQAIMWYGFFDGASAILLLAVAFSAVLCGAKFFQNLQYIPI